MLALNQTSPPVVGTRSTVDHGSDVRLLDGTGRLKADLFELSIEPGLDTREPAGIRPDVHRPSVLRRACSARGVGFNLSRQRSDRGCSISPRSVPR